MTRLLIYPNQPIWEFLVQDEPEPDYDFRGDTPIYKRPLDIVILDIGDDDEDVDIDPRDGDLGGV